jgi:hypothetical protein
MPKLAGNKKSVHETQKYGDGPKKIRGCEKNSAEHKKVFGAHFRIIGGQNKFWGVIKIYSGT